MRSDAERNRSMVLDAASSLVDSIGPAELKIADVAAAAGVGAGTIYRAFGNKAGLLLALLDERERELQNALLSGPGPLGPTGRFGVRSRLEAFVGALFDLTLRDREVLVAADADRYATGAYAAWRLHLTVLLGPGSDVRAELLLAALDPGLLRRLVDDLGTDPGVVRREVLALGRSFV